MNDIRPCFTCTTHFHIDHMKSCSYDYDYYCSQCDHVLIMIEDAQRHRQYVHKDSLEKLQAEDPSSKWKLVQSFIV